MKMNSTIRVRSGAWNILPEKIFQPTAVIKKPSILTATSGQPIQQVNWTLVLFQPRVPMNSVPTCLTQQQPCGGQHGATIWISKEVVNSWFSLLQNLSYNYGLKGFKKQVRDFFPSCLNKILPIKKKKKRNLRGLGKNKFLK